MGRTTIFSVGKTKESWLEEALQEYVTRLRPFMECRFVICKNDQQLLSSVEKEKKLFCLDPNGKEYSSESFAQLLAATAETRGPHLNFVIGGPEGLPAPLRSYPAISFSRMTFTHQLIRLLLLEQLYRAQMILAGKPYHK